MHRAALMGAAEHCPISESIETIKGIDVRIRGADTAEDELV
jgi:hypothetical protein